MDPRALSTNPSFWHHHFLVPWNKDAPRTKKTTSQQSFKVSACSFFVLNAFSVSMWIRKFLKRKYLFLNLPPSAKVLSGNGYSLSPNRRQYHLSHTRYLLWQTLHSRSKTKPRYIPPQTGAVFTLQKAHIKKGLILLFPLKQVKKFSFGHLGITFFL